jgi:hypothetical protein
MNAAQRKALRDQATAARTANYAETGILIAARKAARIENAQVKKDRQ